MQGVRWDVGMASATPGRGGARVCGHRAHRSAGSARGMRCTQAAPPCPPCLQVNEYPGQRTFKAIGTGDQDFVVRLSSAPLKPLAAARLT